MSGYNYQPVKGGDLGGSHLFGGAGELWAGVGKTALAAASQFGDTAKMIQASPLNPAVREAMNYGVAQHKAAEDEIKYRQSLGPMGHVTASVGPEGYSAAAPATISDPTLAAAWQAAALKNVPPPGGGGSGPPPSVNDGGQQKTPEEQGQDDFQQHPENYYQNPATGSYQRKKDAPPLSAPAAPAQKAPPTTGDMGKTTSAASPDMSRIGLVPSQGGSTAASTAGGDGILNTGQPQSSDIEAVPVPRPSGSIWSPMRLATAPPAPGAPPAQSQTPAAATQADQAAMQAWQNQTQTEPMTAQDAMSWIKRKTTLAQDATYLPHGGPGGEPAYAFHMKGGGVNTVPISQMVKDGGGPIVAAQNTSQVLSQSDRIQQQGQPGAQGSAPAPQTPPPDQPQIAQGGPPAAPTGPLPGAQGQPPAAQGPPSAPGDYDPTPYRQAVAQAVANPQNLTAQTAPAGQPAQPAPGQPITPPPSNTTVLPADQAAVQSQADTMPKPTGPYQGDSKVEGNTGPYTYYRDDNPNSTNRGRVYTTLPGPAGQYFNQKRWYLGSPGYENYELPASAGRQQMWDKWGANGYLTRDEISKMSEKEMEPWLQRAWQNEHLQRSSPTDEFNNELDASEKLHNYLSQISDIEHTLADSGYPRLSSQDKIQAATKNAAVSIGAPHGVQIGPVNLPLGNMDAVSAAAMRKLDQLTGATQDLLKTYPKLLVSPGEGGGQETPNIHVGEWFRFGLPNVPASSIINDSAWSGQDIATRSRMLDGLLKVSDSRYKDLISQGQNQWMRIDPKHDANMLKINQGRSFADPDNQYTQRLHTVDPDDYKEFAANHPNTRFLGTDGHPYTTPSK